MWSRLRTLGRRSASAEPPRTPILVEHLHGRLVTAEERLAVVERTLEASQEVATIRLATSISAALGALVQCLAAQPAAPSEIRITIDAAEVERLMARALTTTTGTKQPARTKKKPVR